MDRTSALRLWAWAVGYLLRAWQDGDHHGARLICDLAAIGVVTSRARKSPYPIYTGGRVCMRRGQSARATYAGRSLAQATGRPVAEIDSDACGRAERHHKGRLAGGGRRSKKRKGCGFDLCPLLGGARG